MPEFFHLLGCGKIR